MNKFLFDLSRNNEDINGLFYATGSFGIIDGTNSPLYEQDGNTFIYEDNNICLTAKFEELGNGVFLRKDTLKNISNKPFTLTRLESRFLLFGNDYEVYTQFNGWQYENFGKWQPLSTEIRTSSAGMRSCDGATPLLALYNRQNGITTVFHLISECRWSMSAKRTTVQSKISETTVHTGLCSDNLFMEIAPNEVIELPQVIFYNTRDKLGLGGYKLHRVFNKLYPRKTLPVMYNTWLMDFDNIDFDNIVRQAQTAADLGIEIFTVDAGWFGNGENWGAQIGEWYENTASAFCGRLKELSDFVREKGMKFGIWLEPERALKETKVNKEHPEWFFENEFLDFSNKQAFDYIFSLTCSLIEKYNLGFMKFDFNNTTSHDPKNGAFYRYFKAKHEFVRKIKEKYPDLYISNCASGGMRMDLGHATVYDSYWISDNQGSYEGLDIYLGAIKRLPPAVIEKWNVQTFIENIPEYSKKEHRSIPISCNNATWDFMINVSKDYTKNFLTGNPFGFSCNIADFPESYKQEMKEFIVEYKKDRDFYITACAKILCDTDNIKAIQYFNDNFETVKIQLFTKLNYQPRITIYPQVDTNARYRFKEQIISGKELTVNGITFENLQDNDCQICSLAKI